MTAEAFARDEHNTKWIRVKYLDVKWANAQRPHDEAWSTEIAENFDPRLFQNVVVSQANADGIHHIIDGQHRVHAMRKWASENEFVPCAVMDAVDAKTAAQLFRKINQGTKKPQLVDLFRVGVTAGDPEAVAIHTVLKGAGYKVGYAKSTVGVISAVAALRAVYRRRGGDILSQAVLLLDATWKKDPHAMTGNLIRGFSVFLQLPEATGLDWTKVASRVEKKWTPKQLEAQARARMAGGKHKHLEDEIAEMVHNTFKNAQRPAKLTLNGTQPRAAA